MWEVLYYIILQPTPVLLPGKSHRQRSLVGCSPWGWEESDTTEQLHFHFSLSCVGERNGNPLQCSCLESFRDGGAWWAAVCGVAQSRTQLKQLSSSIILYYIILYYIILLEVSAVAQWQRICQCRRLGFKPWVWKIPWRRKWQPIPVFLPGKSHGQRGLVGYSPRGHTESGTTEQLCTRT